MGLIRVSLFVLSFVISFFGVALWNESCYIFDCGLDLLLRHMIIAIRQYFPRGNFVWAVFIVLWIAHPFEHRPHGFISEQWFPLSISNIWLIRFLEIIA